MSPIRLLALGVLMLLVIGCAPRRSVTVEPLPSRSTSSAARAGEHVVVKGDTLYGIAFRHGLDYRDLASRNGIGPPYTIYPGQRLQLGATPARTVPRTTSRTASPPPHSGGVVGPIARGEPVAKPTPPPSAPARTPSSTSTPTPTPTAQGSTAEPAVAAPVPATPTPATAAPAATPAGPPRWQWPASGQLIGRFLAGDPTRQGINIAGNGGDPVKAAAGGTVVYSGSGLIGYGELIIVKHDETWLSAYGHNRKRLVKEGEPVSAGQQIAEMGRSGASRDMLHFEVRKGGRSVDPLSVLPKR